MMKAICSLVATLLCMVATAYASYLVTERGTWPKSWPGELEPLRKSSRTLVGGELNDVFYEIPFTNREEFESAWPHLLKVRGKDAPIILVRGPNKMVGTPIPAGVRIKHPAIERGGRATGRSDLYRGFIEVVADGNVVDLNRLPLPADTPIIDERFQEKRD